MPHLLFEQYYPSIDHSKALKGPAMRRGFSLILVAVYN